MFNYRIPYLFYSVIGFHVPAPTAFSYCYTCFLIVCQGISSRKCPFSGIFTLFCSFLKVSFKAPVLAISFGASPRASIALALASRAAALLAGRAYVLPQDVKAIAPDVLRHRIVLSYEAEAENINADAVITRLLAELRTP